MTPEEKAEMLKNPFAKRCIVCDGYAGTGSYFLTSTIKPDPKEKTNQCHTVINKRILCPSCYAKEVDNE